MSNFFVSCWGGGCEGVGGWGDGGVRHRGSKVVARGVLETRWGFCPRWVGSGCSGAGGLASKGGVMGEGDRERGTEKGGVGFEEGKGG